MRIYVIRHGESEANEARLWTGWNDVLLTDAGRMQAKKVAALLEGIDFDKIYASDLRRAIETAELAVPGCHPEASARLREVNLGIFAGKPLSIMTEEQRRIVSFDGYQAFGGESRSDFQSRILAFKQDLERQNFQNVAIFTHAGWLKGFLDLAMGTPMPRKNMLCNNCAMAIFEYENAIWKLHSWINQI